MQFRLVILPKRIPKGPWRDTRPEAVADALEQGLASQEDYEGAPVYLDELAEIETRGR